MLPIISHISFFFPFRQYLHGVPLGSATIAFLLAIPLNVLVATRVKRNEQKTTRESQENAGLENPENTQGDNTENGKTTSMVQEA